MQKLCNSRLIFPLRCAATCTWNLPTYTCCVVITGSSKQWRRNEFATAVNKHHRYRLLHTSFLTQSDSEGENQQVAKDQARFGQLRRVLSEYGTVAVIFHTCTSLVSLGICYAVVSMGLDVEKLSLELLHGHVDKSIYEGVSEFAEDYILHKVFSTYKFASTFAVAYILHKMILPVRALITISSVPIIIRFLRMRGIVKSVAKNPSVGRT